jgi:hypothetical protein
MSSTRCGPTTACFNVTVCGEVPDAIKLTGASAFYPKAAIIGRWAAANDCYEPNKLTRGLGPSLHLSIIE